MWNGAFRDLSARQRRLRKMLLGLLEPFQLKTTWGPIAKMLDEAARGGDIMDVAVPLRMVLGMEGVTCRPK